VKLEGIGCILKAVEKWGMGGKGVGESNGQGWMDRSKAHPQQGYI
jgi:hypothetical protein